jgi:uncharacterized protein (DUF779 family)
MDSPAATPTRALTATPRALELIERLVAEHGPLMFFVSGGCCDGSSPQCLRRGELLLGPGDLRLGSIAGADVHIDRDQYERWNHPELVIDVADGAGDTFSLEGRQDVHFVLVAPSG